MVLCSITMHSGLTVEVANTDAEGRFLLSDGLSWLARVKGVKWLLDAATLTGHSVGTGKAHAGVVSNTAALEQLAVKAGLVSGDHVMPMIFAPEILGPGFSSPVADLKNTGSTDQGAGSAAAGIFIFRHIEVRCVLSCVFIAIARLRCCLAGTSHGDVARACVAHPGRRRHRVAALRPRWAGAWLPARVASNDWVRRGTARHDGAHEGRREQACIRRRRREAVTSIFLKVWCE